MMDRARPKSRAQSIKRIALTCTLALVFVAGGGTLASIDFSSCRIDRDTGSIETVQRGRWRSVSANALFDSADWHEVRSSTTAARE